MYTIEKVVESFTMEEIGGYGLKVVSKTAVDVQIDKTGRLVLLVDQHKTALLVD